MTRYFKPVKIVAQDDPVTVDQIRALVQNNNYIKYDWRNTIFNASWIAGSTTGNGIEKALKTPIVRFIRGMDALCFGAVLYNSTASAVSATITITLKMLGYDIVLSDTTSIAVGVSMYEKTFDLSGFHNTFYNNAIRRGIEITTDVVATGVYWQNVSFWGEKTDEINVKDPQYLQVADDLDIKYPSSVLNNMADVPLFLGGYLYADGEQVTKDAGSSSQAEDLQIYHLLDKYDDDNSEEKCYNISTLIKTTTTASSNDVNLVGALRESTDTETVTRAVLQDVDADLSILSSSLTGESWSTTAGSESVVSADIFTDGGTRDGTYLYGAELRAFDSLPLSDNRKQLSSRTAVNVDYFDVGARDTIDADVINSIGRAQYNNVFRRSGQYTSLICKGGSDVALTLSSQNIWYAPNWIKNLWLTNYRDRGTAQGIFSGIIYNGTGASYDIVVNLQTNDYGDSQNLSFTLSIGYNYIYDEFSLGASGSANLERFDVRMYGKTATGTIKIYSLTMQYSDYVSTY